MMWLIDTGTLRLKSFQGKIPRYAILSHTWCPDEITFADFQVENKSTTRDEKAGFHKIKLTCEQARTEGISYAWVDTCCINKESSAELSEAINSMFKWYSLATVCYAYLEDFPQSEETNNLSLLRGCRWFSRGWTLQELLAPRDLVFFAPHGKSWRKIGRKDGLEQVLEQITNIPGEILLKQKAIDTISVAARMSWAARRQTTQEEDLAYCLMGIFNVNMPLLYGEGPKAFIRLQEEILRETRDDSLFAWCSTKEAAAETPYRGLFAGSPDEFLESVDIEHFDADEAGAGSTTSMLGQGRVSLSCSVYPGARDRVILTLKCFRGDLSNIQGIQCVRIGENYYLRSKPSQLFRCSLGPRTSVTIDKYAMKTETNKDDHVYGRDSICLCYLPNGMHLRAVHSEVHSEVARRFLRQSPPIHRWVPISWAIGRKMAFEIEVDRRALGYGTQSGESAEDRLLILFWVEPIPESRTYGFRFNLEKSSIEDATIKFGSAMKPQESIGGYKLTIGRTVVYVDKFLMNMRGYERLYFHVSTEANKKPRAKIIAELRHYNVDEAQMETQSFGTAPSSGRAEVGIPRRNGSHSRRQAQGETGTEHYRTHSSLTRYRRMRLLMAGIFIIVSLLSFSLLSGNLMFGLLITSFMAVMLVMPILASTRIDGRKFYIDQEDHGDHEDHGGHEDHETSPLL